MRREVTNFRLGSSRGDDPDHKGFSSCAMGFGFLVLLELFVFGVGDLIFFVGFYVFVFIYCR